jgi:hypothetical protein
LIGANPVFGYSLTDYVDAALVINYTYNSIRDFNGIFNNKLRQSTYGGGGLLRIYPMRSIFLQGQLEHNFIRQRSIPVLGPPGNLYSPYTDAFGRSVPLFRGGVQIPLFQENSGRGRFFR